jgi:hypothetical protein
MDILKVADEIEKKIKESEAIRKAIRERIELSAVATANYDKAIGLTMIKLSSGQVQQIEDGESVVETGHVIPSNFDKIARAVCWRERLEMEKADGLLKSAIKNLDAVASELNGWQSIYRHLDSR